MSELLHVLDVSFERGPRSLKSTPPPAIMPSVLTTRPRPICQKRTGTSRMVSHFRHNSKPTLSRNDSSLGCLHQALAYKYYFGMTETRPHVSVHWQQGKYQLWAHFSCAGCQFRTRASESQGNSANCFDDQSVKNELAPAVSFQSPGTIASRLCEGTVLHWPV